jgi:hypothetical protein
MMSEEQIVEETAAIVLGREFESVIRFYDYWEIIEHWFRPATSEQRSPCYFYVALTRTGAAVVDGKTPSHRLIVVNQMASAATLQQCARMRDRGELDRIYGIADKGYVIDRPGKLKELFDIAVCHRADLLAVDDSLFLQPIRDELLKESSAIPLWPGCRIVSAHRIQSLP